MRRSFSKRSSRCGPRPRRSSASSRSKRMTASVRGIRSVAVDVCALDEAEAFYTDVWKLTLAASLKGARYLRGTCAHHHILSLHQAAHPAIRRVTFDAADRDVVMALHARVKGTGLECETPHEL